MKLDSAETYRQSKLLVVGKGKFKAIHNNHVKVKVNIKVEALLTSRGIPGGS